MQPTTIYLQTDIPPGMTCTEYRHRHVSSPRHPHLARLRHLLRQRG